MKRLKELREAYGLSQQKLASNFHLSQQSIYKYENNLAEPDIDMLKSMAAFFDTSVDYLIEYTDNCSAYVSSSPNPTSTEHRLLTYYRKLSPRLRRIIFDLIQESAEKSEETQPPEETPTSEAADTEKREEEN